MTKKIFIWLSNVMIMSRQGQDNSFSDSTSMMGPMMVGSCFDRDYGGDLNH